MCFRILLTILVISAYSQINAELLDEREAAERLFAISDCSIFSDEPKQAPSSIWTTTEATSDESTEPTTEMSPSSKQDIINKLMKDLGHCQAIPHPVPAANSAQQPTTPITLPKHANGTGKELWNQLSFPTTIIRSLMKGRLDESDPELETKLRSDNFITRMHDKNLKEQSNTIWYGLLLMNLLKIKCHSDDETLKELWFKIPQPPNVPKYGNISLNELWYNQTLPPLALNKSKEPSADSELDDDTVVKEWDKFHYQLLFYRILQIKFPSDEGTLEDQWNKISPIDVDKRRDVIAKEFWNELTLPVIKPEDNTFITLISKLYQPSVFIVGKELKFNSDLLR